MADPSTKRSVIGTTDIKPRNSGEVPCVCADDIRIKQEHGLFLVHFK